MFKPIFRTDKIYVECQYTCNVNRLCHRMAVCQALNRYSLRWIKSFMYTKISRVKVLVVLNYMNFVTCEKS